MRNLCFRKTITAVLCLVLFCLNVNTNCVAAANDLPKLYLTVPASLGAVHADKNTEYPATAQLTVPDGYVSEYGSGAVVDDTELTIKGRGNSTWDWAKKPYALKFSSAIDLFGMGAAKKWILLANYADRTQIRNKLVFDLSGKLGMDYIKSVFVELYINGAYQGTYQLCEKAEIGPNRAGAGNAEFMLELDAKVDYANEIWFTTTNYSYPYRIHDPSCETGDSTYNNIRSYVENFEKALRSPNFYNALGKRYDDYFDLTSLADHFILQEFTKNVDAMFSSTFMYKLYNGKMYMGPAWDFDLAFGNVPYNDCGSPTGWYQPNQLWYSDRNSWHYGVMVKDRAFMDKLVERYEAVRPILEGLYYDGGGQTSDVTLLLESLSASKNYSNKWNISDGTYLTNPYKGSPAAEVTYLRNFIKDRLAWFDAELPKLYEKSSYVDYQPPVTPDKGKGTKDDPYIIENEQHFQWFTDVASGNDFYFRQIADLDMTELSGYNGIVDNNYGFRGVYDGGGHVINVNINGAENCVFPYLYGAVRNVGITGRINNTSYTGGIARSVREGGVIANSYCTADITAASTVGGIASSNVADAKILNCYFGGSITQYDIDTGPILGLFRDGAVTFNNYYTYSGKQSYPVPNSYAENNKDSIPALMNGEISSLPNYLNGTAVSDFAEWTFENGAVSLIPMGDPEPGAVLMSLTRETATAAEAGNLFNADEGIYADVSNLTAWDNNTQITIGGTGRTPIVINYAATSTADGWLSAQSAGIDNASAFEIKFKTANYQNIRFSCSQKSTGSGPDKFQLAYRIGSSGDFTVIPDSETGSNGITAVPRVSNDTYAALAATYNNFVLPADLEDEDEVYLRVVFTGLTGLGKNGNTSINDIVITGDEIEGGIPKPSDNANLSNLTVNGTQITGFNANTTKYSVTVLQGEPVTVVGTAAHSAAGVEYNHNSSFSGEVFIPKNGDLLTVIVTAENGTVVKMYNITFEVTPVQGDVLVGLSYPSVTDPGLGNNVFAAKWGIYQSDSNLTAWDDNTQRKIGYEGSARTPVVFNNASTVNGWNPIALAGVDHASAFQIKFRTDGYENIRFTAKQKSTASGPDKFRLAYSASPSGPFILIEDTLTGTNGIPDVPRVGDDTYGALAATYIYQPLPLAVADQNEIYLRVIFAGDANLGKSGNTSINDILITGDPIVYDSIAYDQGLIIARPVYDGDKKGIKVLTKNNTGAPLSLTYIVAVYNTDPATQLKTMVGVKIFKINGLGNTDSNREPLDVSDMDFAAGNSVRVLIFGSLNTLLPLASVTEVWLGE